MRLAPRALAAVAGGNRLTAAHLYDAWAGTGYRRGEYAQLADAPFALGNAVAALDRIGRPVLIGGQKSNAEGGTVVATIHRYDGSAWPALPWGLPSPVMNAAICRLADGSWLITGGMLTSAYNSTPNPSAWRLTLGAVPSLTTLAQPPVARRSHTLVRSPATGLVYAIGGFNNVTEQVLSSVDVYNPDTNAWSAGPALPTGRWTHASCVLADGRVLTVGGVPGVSGGADSRAYALNPSTGVWSEVASAPAPIRNAVLLPLADGRAALFHGGNNPSGAWATWVTSWRIYDPTANVWATVTPAVAAPVVKYAAAVVRAAGGVFALAGSDGTPGTSYVGASKSAYAYAPLDYPLYRPE